MRTVVFWEIGWAILAQTWVGCASQRVLDTELAGYVESFKQEVITRLGNNDVAGADIEVHFGEVPYLGPYNSEALAYCKMGDWHHRQKEVVVNFPEWRRLSAGQKEALMLHELGHCLLGRVHGRGIMTPRLIASGIYEKHRTVLLNELITRKKTAPHVVFASPLPFASLH